jgi:hypothetical protein
MHTTRQVEIQAAFEAIFTLAERVEDWGTILPHYRYVKLLRREGNRKWVRMSAWRDFIPVTWSAIQTVVRGTNAGSSRILFQHTRGLVRGMKVVWWFREEPERGLVVVGITHQLDKPPFPTRLLGKRLTELVVGKGFIGYIAGKTLRRIKELAQDEASVETKPRVRQVSI